MRSSKFMSRVLPDNEFNLLRYVPNVLLDQFIQSASSNIKTYYPQTHSFKTLLLNTNLLQFSQISQHMTTNYLNGLEIIADLHKQYVELLQEYIGPTGGDMFKYTTDRLIFYWPIVNSSADEYLIDLCRVVIDQLVKLSEILPKKLHYNNIILNVSFVLTIGNINVTSIGYAPDSNEPLQTSLEHIYTGQSILEALDSHVYIFNGTSILVDNAVVDRSRSYFHFEEIELLLTETEDENRSFEREQTTRLFILKGLKQNMETNANIDPFYFKNDVSGDQFDLVKESIYSYIPACVVPYAFTNTEAWASELRQATALFINIPIDILTLRSKNEFHKLQNIVERLYRIFRIYHGFVYRVYIDKTGLNVSAVFGLYLQGNSEITARAVLVSTLVVQSLSKINIPAFVGVSTGTVMTSINGQFRKEYFIIGEPLYMSYLLSLMTLKDRVKRILVDHKTKMEAESKITFRAYTNRSFTGKMSQGVFEPLYGSAVVNAIPANPFPEIRTHRFNIEQTENTNKEDYEDSVCMFGRERFVNQANKFILDFLRSPDQVAVLLITGKHGIGKSLFLRNILEEAQMVSQGKLSAHNRPFIFASSLDCIKEKRSLNGWRNIMRQVAEELAGRFDLSIEELINRVLELEQHRQGSVRLIDEMVRILGDTPLDDDGCEKDLDIMTGETTEGDLDEEDEETLMEVMIRILQYFVGEKSLFTTGSRRNRGYEEGSRNQASSLILCFDDMHNHDAVSWKLLKRVSETLSRILILGALREDDKIESRASQVPSKYDQQSSIYGNKNFLAVLEELNDYQDRCLQESMNRATDSVKSNVLRILMNQNSAAFSVIELEALQQNVIQKLTTRVLGGNISDEVFKLVVNRSAGNCLTAVDVLGSALKQGLLEIADDNWVLSKNLKRFVRLGQFIEVIVPDSESRRTAEQFDSLNFIQLSLAKLASIIGYKFDLKSLVFSNILNHTILPSSVLSSCLQELVTRKIVSEITENGREKTYQFNSSFMREALYQLIPTGLKRIQHQNIAICWQNETRSISEEQLLYQWELAQGQMNSHEEAEKQIAVTKTIEETLSSRSISQADIILKAGRIQKRSKMNNKWAPRYAVLTKLVFKLYRSEADFKQKPASQKVLIRLRDIITIARFGEGKKLGFKIATNSWMKNSQENRSREFYFACRDEQESDEWIFSLDYLKYRSVYEEVTLAQEPRSSSYNKPRHSRTLSSKLLPPSQNVIAAYEWEDQEEQSQSAGKQDYRSQGSDDSIRKRSIMKRASSIGMKSNAPIQDYEGNSLMNISNNLERRRSSSRSRARSPDADLQDEESLMMSQTKNHDNKADPKSLIKAFLSQGQILLYSHMFSEAVKPWKKKSNFGSTPELVAENKLLKVGSDTTQRNMRSRDRGSVRENSPEPSSYSSKGKVAPQSFDNMLERVKLYDSKSRRSSSKLEQFDQSFNDEEKEENNILRENRRQKEHTKRAVPAKAYDSGGITEIVNKTSKNAAARNFSNPSLNDLNKPGTGPHRKKSPKPQRANEDKYNRQHKPNLYGKYSLESAFFGDSYMNNTALVSHNNNINRVQAKRFVLGRRNRPTRKEMRFLEGDDYEEQVYLYEEEDSDRLMLNEYGKTLKRGRQSAEPPIYFRSRWDTPNNAERDIRGGDNVDISSSAASNSGNNRLIAGQARSKISTSQPRYDENIYIMNQGDDLEAVINRERVYKEKPKASYASNKTREPANLNEWQPNSQIPEDNPIDRYRADIQRMSKQTPHSGEYARNNLSNIRSVTPTNIRSYESSKNVRQTRTPERAYNTLRYDQVMYPTPQEHARNISPSSTTPKQIYLAVTIMDLRSQDGDDFRVPRGEFIVVTRIFERHGMVEILWNGVTGLIPGDGIQIVQQVDLNQIKKHITLGRDLKSQTNNLIESLKMIYSDRTSQGTTETDKSLHDIYQEHKDFQRNQYQPVRSANYEQAEIMKSRSPNVELRDQRLADPQEMTSKSPNKLLMRQMRRQQEMNANQDEPFVTNTRNKR